MTWRIEVVHTSTYRYGGPAIGSYNEVRMTPTDGERQRLLDHRLHVSPHVSLMHYRDYWGTRVDAFDVHQPHTELSIVSSSTVETSPPRGPRASTTWADLAATPILDAWGELLSTTVYTDLGPGNDDLVNRLRADGVGSPESAARNIAEWVRGSMDYRPGTTVVSTPASESLRTMSGVCQDFADVTIGLARAMGIPARYVSGYLHPDADAELGQKVSGQSHAWVELWLGDWRAFDPTNGAAVGERHIVVGRGRDYADVSPLKGVYQGSSAAELRVTVQLTRTA